MRSLEETYDCLLNDVAGVVFEGFGHFDTALLEAKNEAYGNYQMTFEEILEQANKTEDEFKNEVLKRIEEWNNVKENS